MSPFLLFESETHPASSTRKAQQARFAPYGRNGGSVHLLSDYLATNFAGFEEAPFNEVDSAALTQLCMVRGMHIIPLLVPKPHGFAGVRSALRNAIAPRKAGVSFRELLRAEHFGEMFTGLEPQLIKENLFALAASPRFRRMTACNYLSLFDKELETQFAGMTFLYEDEFAYVGFRGTDMTLTGWKEDFNMAYAAPVPAQEMARYYLEEVARTTSNRLIVGGHSKGGNLAEYAALKATPAVQERIECVYVHDGPGFKPNTFTASDYAPLEGKLRKTVPQDSLIGILLESQAPLSVAHSIARGIDQHSVFTWEVREDNTGFVHLDALPESTVVFAATVQEWLARLDDDNKKGLVEALFRIIETSGAEDARDILSGGIRTLSLITEAMRNIDADDMSTLASAGRGLIESAAEQAGDSLGRTVERMIGSLGRQKAQVDEANETNRNEKA